MGRTSTKTKTQYKCQGNEWEEKTETRALYRPVCRGHVSGTVGAGLEIAPPPPWTQHVPPTSVALYVASCHALPCPGPGPLPPTPRDVPSSPWVGQWPGSAGTTWLRCVRTAAVLTLTCLFFRTSNTRPFGDLHEGSRRGPDGVAVGGRRGRH